MNRIAKILWILFFTCSVIVLISKGLYLEDVASIIHPLLIPLLAAALFVELSSQKNAKSVAISFGCKDKFHLLCTYILYSIGTIIVCADRDARILQAMTCFMFGHIAYMLFFIRMLPEIRKKVILWYALALIVPSVVIPISFDQDIRISIFMAFYFYAILLLALVGYATLLLSDSIDRIDDEDDPDSWNENDALHRAGKFILFGALSFLVSDFIITIKFVLGVDFPYAEAFVLLVYIIAQVNMAKAVLGLQSRFCMFLNVRKK